MANRFDNPRPQFWSSTAVYAGGTLTFYQSGTSTPLDTYSDSTLLVANSNPLTLNSAGRPSVDIFLSDAPYKVVLKDVDGNTIWTADPVYTSDYSGPAQFSVYAGNPNGNVAGAAGSGSVKADAIWDTINNILYICTATGTSVTAVWTAVNSSTAAAVVVFPQGRLSPSSGSPIVSGDVTSSSAVYYTPYVGNIVPIYNGSTYAQSTFSELTLSLVSNHSQDQIYDVFVFSNAGVITLVTGPAWSDATPGSCSRGTGAGTTELSRINGLWVNAVDITGRNGSSTYSISANRATYLGSIFIDGVAGQVTCHRTYGQSRKFGVWNAFNRVPILLRGGDGTASWSYTTNTWRSSNNTAANSIKTFCGLAEEMIEAEFLQVTGVTTSTTNIGIGLNSTTSPGGFVGPNANAPGANNAAKLVVVPGIGINTLSALEKTSSGATATYFGTETNMFLAAQYNG